MPDRVDGPRVYAATVLVLVVMTLVMIAFLGGSSGAGPSPPEADPDSYNVTDDGTRYTVPPSRLVQGCPGGRDCIPAIDDPKFQSAENATWLADEDLVIGVELNGETRAYPLRILTVHEIVNDEIGDEPVAVTYCPLCRSGLVFSRSVHGETLSFGVSGKLLEANLVMYDRETETYWSQVKAEAIVGPLVPTRLTILPSTITTWGEWREAHPDTRVLSRDTGIYAPETYAGDPYADYKNSDRVGYGVDQVDGRLPAKTIVYGVTIGNASTAYPETVVKREEVINDEVNGIPVVIVEDQRDGSVEVFIRRVNNETLRFSVTDTGLVDETDHNWGFDGTAREGPHEGATLDRLNTHGFYWFAWSSYHPETDLYNDSS